MGDAPDAMPKTLPALLSRTVDARGDSVAVREGTEIHSWHDVATLVDALAAGLAARGVTPGAHIALWLPNGLTYLAAIFAVARLGAIAVHINTRYGSHEIGNVVARSRASIVITQSAFGGIDLASTLGAIDPAQLARVDAIVFADAPPAIDSVVALEPLPLINGAVPADHARPDAPSTVYTSSGTTAEPKLVTHDQASIARHADAVMRRIGLGENDAKLLATVPFCGTFGNVAVMAAVSGGAEIVCLDVFNGFAAAALIREQRVTHLFGDDRMVARLVEAADARPYDSVRFSAIAAFHPDSVTPIAAGIALGLHPHSIYGSSEAQALFALAPQPTGEQVAVVPVSPGSEVRIDGDQGSELLLRGPSLFREYLGDSERTARSRDADGFFRTGDRCDPAGPGFFFRSRLDDVLRLGGFLVNPLEIEDFLQAMPGIASAQVVAVDHGGRTLPFAFAIADGQTEVAEEHVLADCRASLARYKVPVRVALLDAFPSVASANGVKIQRGRLRELAQQSLVADPVFSASKAGREGRIPTTETAQ